MARKHRVSVTYDVVTEDSATDGDHADNGYIHPQTERRRSFSSGRKRDIERNMRLARAGKFDFPSLRAAIEFIDARNCGSHETCWQRSDDTMSVYTGSEYQDCNTEYMRGSRVVSVTYCLHIEGTTYGTLDRIARVLARNGVYFSNVPALIREAIKARRGTGGFNLVPDAGGKRAAFIDAVG